MATQKKYVSLEKLTKYDELLKAKIKADDDVVLDSAKDYADSLASNYDVAGAAATAKSEAIEAAKTETTTQVNALANGQVKTNKEAIAAIKDGTTIDSFADVEAALAGKQAAGDYATKAEAQGYANAKDGAIAEAKAAGEAAGAAAGKNAEEIAKIHDTNDGILAQAKGYADGKAGDVQASVDTLAAKVGTVPEGSTVMGIIANIQENAYDDTDIQGKIDGVSAKVDTLVGNDANKSVRAIAAEELAAQLVAEGAAESLDTLEEIAAWIQNHPDDAAAMNAAIEALQTKVNTGDKTVSAYVTDAINALSIGDYAKAADLTALAGRVTALETASATHALKTEVEAVSNALTEYKDAHNGDYTNTQIDNAIKAVADNVAALDDTYATDDELAAAIEGEVTRANAAYAAKSLETTVANLSTTVDTKAAQSDVDTLNESVDSIHQWISEENWVSRDSLNTTVQTLNANIDKKADKATTLAGYGITNAYTSGETDTAIANAMAQFVEVSEAEINALFAASAN